MTAAAASNSADAGTREWDYEADPEWIRLAQRVRRHFATRRKWVEIDDWRVQIWKVADPDALFEAMAEREEETGEPMPWEPYWARAWDSAMRLAEVLRSRDLAGCHVLDLGCGLGLSGVAAASRGARVVLADLATPALLFARLNCWPWRSSVTARRVDWQTDRLASRFDLIVGADILYEVRQWPHLERFWNAHLKAEGEVLLGEPDRRSSDGFADQLRDHGWRIEPLRRQEVRIWRCWPNPASLASPG